MNTTEPKAILAYREIEEAIVTLKFQPGSMLSEGEISSEFNLGRTPMREALHRLEREGLVEIHPRRGVQVTPIDVFQQLRLHEVRRPLSLLMVKCAVLRATPEERQNLMKLAENICLAAKENDGQMYILNSKRIQLTLAHASQNEVLIRMLGSIHGMSRRFWFAHFERSGSLEIAATMHADIARAVASGDLKLAEKNVSSLMSYLEDFYRSVINEKTVR